MKKLLKIAFGIYPRLSIISFFIIVFSILLDLPLPLLTIYFIDHVLTGKDIHLLNMVGAGLLVFLFLKIAIEFTKSYLNILLSEKIIMKYGIETFKNCLNSYYLSLIAKPSGYWVNRIQNEPQSISQIFRTIIEILNMSITFIVGIVLIFYFSYNLGILVLIILPFYGGAIFIMGPKIKKQHLFIKEERSKLSGFLEESMNGLEILKVLVAENFKLSELKANWKKLVDANIRMTVLISINNLIASSFASLAPIGVLWYGGYLVISGSLSLGVVIGINKFLSYVFRPISSMMNINAQLQDSFTSLDRLDEIINFPKEKLNGQHVTIKSDSNIRINNLRFSYDSRKIFDNLNLDIKGGKTTAILGSSGCGKSTIFKLMVGLLQSQDGIIRIEDNNINEINVKSLREQVCLIPQNAYMFSGNLAYNIKLGNNGRDIDNSLFEVTGINKFINELSDRLDHDIGSRGLKISGGQRQRIALARALLREPKILLMDEVTSEIDLETEKEIIEKLIELRKGKTTVIVAHGIAAVRKADDIIVMGNGNIIERGSHEELINNNGTYKKLWLMNAGEIK
jgi:ATP-binding cassette, subfamily C, bacteriocin exporter